MAMAMAMTEDGTNDSRETSPDPIVLPSSPLSGRKLRTTRKRASTPRKSRLSQQQTRATPSKEIILDTPQLGITNDGSPWRIKVTVQAEQRDSPGKMVTRTTSIPLMNSPSQRKRSASPVKRRKATPKKTVQQQQDGDDEVVEVKKRGRKRKGTPLKEKRSAPQLRARQSVEEVPQHEPEVQPEEQQQDDQDHDVYGEAAALEAEQAMQVLDSESHTPPNHRRASGRLARLNAQYSDGTGRTKRLSRAREELDEALQDAVGDGYGDLTLSRAEDFTMVSLESLQTTKEASLLHNSQLSRSHLSTVREGEGEKSALSVSYLPSSPPKGQAIPQYPDLSAVKAQTTVLSPWQPSIKHLTAQTTLQSPFEPTSSTRKKKSMLRQSIDAMSWKPALLSGTKTSSSKLNRSQPVLQTPLDQSTNVSDEARSQWQREREAVSQQIQQASPENVVTVDDDEHMSDAEDEGDDDAGGDGDVWQTEASRELERPDTTSTDDRPIDSQRSERVEDLFAHLPLKPARPKIPRTWRRSSGMDFSYIDSPAHLPLAETANDRRHSTDGSGVLTPPSTDQSEEGDNFEETAGTVDLQGGADDQLQSEFTQPETEGTRYQDEDSDDQMLDDGDMEDELHQDDEQAQNSEDEFEIINHEDKRAPRTSINRDDEYVPSRNDSKSPLSEAESPDEADKAIARSMLPPSSRSTRSSQKRGSAFERGIMNGSFPSDVDFEPTRQRRSRSQAQKTSTESPDHAAAANAMSQVTNNKDKPRRRPPRRPTADLADLLGLASSPVKPLHNEVRVSEVGKPAQHLRSGSSSAQKKSSPLSARHMDKIRKDSPSGGATKQKMPNVAARNNLLNASNIAGSAQQTSDEDELARPLSLERPAPSAQAMFLSPPKLTHDPITGKLLPQPKRRGRRRKVGDEGQTESTVTDSFASKESEPTQRTESQLDTSMADSFTSKTSDQRQLLQESAVKKKMPPPAATNWSRELQSSAIKRKELHLQRQAEELAAAAAEANRQSTGVGNRDYAQPQRRQMQVTYPDDEQDDLQADEQEEQRIRGHRRIISAVDSNTEMPDDEGTHAQMQDVSYSGEQTYEDESTAQPDHLRSYEENLNLDSPTKIRVNFNDTMSFSKDVDQTSSWLAEPRRRPTLFDTNAPAQRPSQPQPGSGARPLSVHAPELTLADKQQAQVSGTGLFSKLSTTLWNAVVRPSGPTEVYAQSHAQVHAQSRASAPAPVIQQLQNLGDDSFTLTLRSQLRGRYGVLSERFPWTMAHQRTLHRMLNSVCSGRPDTLIPRKGRLPRELEKSINAICTSVTGFRWVFTKDQAYVVHSFMHTLVAEDLVTDMKDGEVEFIGDETAMAIRGYLDPERHGDDHVWTLKRGHPKTVVGYVDKQKGKILLDFVIKALGDCVLSNEVLRQRLVKEGREEDFERIAYGIEVR